MNMVIRQIKAPGERVSAFLLALGVTVLVFAAISAGFTPHASDLAARVTQEPMLTL
jgi:hypothetical protein